jgi:hypothetical protein
MAPERLERSEMAPERPEIAPTRSGVAVAGASSAAVVGAFAGGAAVASAVASASCAAVKGAVAGSVAVASAEGMAHENAAVARDGSEALAWGAGARGRGRLPRARRFLGRMAAESGEGFIDVLVKMLIVVVVGAVLLSIMRTAVPQLFSDMIDKIRSVFEL